jgi:hypothetical protein
MKFSKAIREAQAEIVANKIPANKVFINGNIPKEIPPEWKKVLNNIIDKLREKGIMDKFTKDADPLDISGEKPKGDIRLKADTGEQYIYNVDSQTLKKA